MATNSGTADSPTTLLTNASGLVTYAKSDQYRYLIDSLNKLNNGVMVNTNPTTQQVGFVIGKLRTIEGDQELIAVLINLLISVLGGTPGRTYVITGTGTPPPTVYADKGAIYTDTTNNHIYINKDGFNTWQFIA
jgi:hypothetical protein